MEEPEIHMRRALELAALGKGLVSPNPLVGCVVTHEGKIIGEGWHKKYGEAHAEVNAINSVLENNRKFLPESTVYVTLEPCAHFGNTPPCADMLVREKVKKVVICNLDPFPLVNGKGIEKLLNAGILVETGLLESEGRDLNKRFFTSLEKSRPYIILKWAETADGFIARKNFDSKWISNELSRTLAHKMRAEEDAIMVGTNTAFYDNPSLNVRDWHGENPVRVVLDTNLRLPENLNLFDGSQETICYNRHKNDEKHNLIFAKTKSTGNDFLNEIIDDLYKRKIQSLIVEGGSQLIQQFIDQGLWDEAFLFKSNTTFNEGIPAPQINNKLIDVKNLEEDRLFCFRKV